MKFERVVKPSYLFVSPVKNTEKRVFYVEDGELDGIYDILFNLPPHPSVVHPVASRLVEEARKIHEREDYEAAWKYKHKPNPKLAIPRDTPSGILKALLPLCREAGIGLHISSTLLFEKMYKEEVKEELEEDMNFSDEEDIGEEET